MKLVGFLLILGITQGFAQKNPAQKTEAGVPSCPNCGPVDPKAKPQTVPSAREIFAKQCESDLKKFPMEISWSLQPCDGIDNTMKDTLKRCTQGEPDWKTGAHLLSILAMNLFDREYQLVMRGTPLDPKDNETFYNFLRKWEGRLGNIPDESFRNQILEAIKASREQWHAQAASDKKSEGAVGLDMAAARITTAYFLAKGLKSDAYVKNLVAQKVPEARAKEMQAEELDAVMFEYPEFVDMDDDELQWSAIDRIGGLSLRLNTATDEKVIKAPLAALPPDATAEEKEQRKMCDNITEAPRMARIGCRAQALGPELFPRLDATAAEKTWWGAKASGIEGIKTIFSNKTKNLYKKLDEEWNNAAKDTRPLLAQPELLAQLTAINTLNKDDLGTLRAFSKRCEAETSIADTLKKWGTVEKVAAYGTMGLAVLSLFGRGGSVGGGRMAVAMNSTKMLKLAQGFEAAGAVAGIGAMIGLVGTSTYRILDAHNTYKREMMNFMISNTRESAGVSNTYRNLQSAIAQKRSAWTDAGIVAASMMPMAISMKFASMAKNTSQAAQTIRNTTGAGAAQGAARRAMVYSRISSGVNYADMAIDAGWVGFSAYHGNYLASAVQTAAFSSRFGRGASQVVREMHDVQARTYGVDGRAIPPSSFVPDKVYENGVIDMKPKPFLTVPVLRFANN